MVAGQDQQGGADRDVDLGRNDVIERVVHVLLFGAVVVSGSVVRSMCALMRFSLGVPADQVKQREKEDPDDVDEVPVQAEVLDKRDVARWCRPRPGRERS